MKKLHLALFFLLVVVTASAQKVYFVYIQTENEQPFYVKLNDKLSSSTALGYIILPKLLDSSYSFSIGFPQNKWPEQNFTITINTKDHGFLLKNFGEKGWGLFNLQTLTIQMPVTGKASINKNPEVENGVVSVFTEMLSRAASDPSLLEMPLKAEVENKKTEIAIIEANPKEAQKIDLDAPVSASNLEIIPVQTVKNELPKVEIKETDFGNTIHSTEQSIETKEGSFAEEKKKNISKPVEFVEKSVGKKEETLIEIQKQSFPSSKESGVSFVEPSKSALIKKWSESSTTEGFGLVFIDENENGLNDTIRLLIPNQKLIFGIANQESVEERKTFAISSEKPQKEDSSVIRIENIDRTTKANKQIPEENTVLKNNCNQTATESDFYLLRKNMAAVLNDEDMIAEAKKYFKTKCFNSAQLKNLSTLFLNDEGKYKFFDVSYKYVSDLESFTTLQSELKDEYFAGLFKAMIRN
jgi:hypothetical protein